MSRVDDLLYAKNPRGPQTAAWLTQFWKAWESLNGVGRHQLEFSDQRRLQAQADSLYRVGFTAKRAAWMASERHGMPIGRMPNPDGARRPSTQAEAKRIIEALPPALVGAPAEELGPDYCRALSWLAKDPRVADILDRRAGRMPNPYRCGQDMRKDWADGTTWVELKCDICGKQHPVGRARALDTRRFEDEGWVIAQDNTAACPDCMKKRAAELWKRRLSNPCGGHRRRNPDSSWHQDRMQQWDRALPHAGYNNRLVRGRLSEAQDSYIESRRREGPKANPSVELSELRKIKGFQEWMLDHPDFKRGLEKYLEFHGVLPTRISQKDMPGVVPKGKAAFFVGMGKGVEETYLPTDKRSSKHGSAYIHKYADNKGKSATEKDLPDKICSVDGKTILTVGGQFKVSDWIRG